MLFINNKYTRLYYTIVNNALSRINETSYCELHHIVPRSLGGKDDQKNLVRLTAREHFICHWLLVKMTKNEEYRKMVFAFNMMLKCKSNRQDRYYGPITSRLYEKYKVIDSNIKKQIYFGRVRNKTLYKFCHVDGRIELCSINEMSKKYNILRSSLGHLVKKPEGKHHVKGWSINVPLASQKRSDLYTGAGGPKYDHTLYSFCHKNGTVENCTKYDLFTKYNLSRNGIYAICAGIQKTSQGWSLNQISGN